jgi:hypothetical protein
MCPCVKAVANGTCGLPCWSNRSRSCWRGSAIAKRAWHQIVELPAVPVQITEYQAHGRTCPGCGHITWAKIPDAIRAHGCGPRLTATLSYGTPTNLLTGEGRYLVHFAAFRNPVPLIVVPIIGHNRSGGKAKLELAAR